MRYERSKQLETIHEAVLASQAAVALTSQRDMCYAWRLERLGRNLCIRYGHSEDPEDLSKAIDAFERSLEADKKAQPWEDLATVLERLAYTLIRRFQRTGQLEDVEQAIEAQQQVVRLAAHSNRNLPVCLANLAAAFLARYQRYARDPSDIEEAISILKRASMSPGATAIQLHIDRNLANAYCTRASHFGAIEDHDEAVRIYRSIHFRSQSSSRLDQFQALYSLGRSLYRRFQRRGRDAVADHEEAIAFLRQGLEMAPSPSYPFLPAALAMCGVALRARFQRLGSMEDIHEAIVMLEGAIKASASPEIPSINMGGLLHELGHAYQTKFWRTREPTDINNAVSSIEKSLSHIPAGDPRHWVYLLSLGSALHSRFASEKGGTEADIEQSVKALQKSVSCAPPADPDYSGVLGTLGNALASRYKLIGSAQDAQDSISSLTMAINLLPEDHPDASIHRFNLAKVFQARFERSKSIKDNAEAIETYLKGIDGYPKEHALLPIMYEDLAHSLHTRFKETSLQEDLIEAVSVYRRSARSSVGPPSVRLYAACQWALLCDLYNPSECLEAYEVAIRLTSEVASLQETVKRRHGYMEKSSIVPLQAAATAFSMGETVKALEWLEQGRCLVWNQIAMLRSPLDTLRAYDKRLAERLIALHAEAKNHASLANEWHGIVKSIRSIPGLEDFLQPTSYEHLRLSLPASGYVVMVNVSEKRCDSVVLTHGPDEPLHIPLTNFSFEKASSLHVKLDRQLRSNVLLSRKDSIPGEEQGLTGVPSDAPTKPRIWWCVTGPLVFLPLHAAGVYGADEHRVSALDYAISSYIPTIGYFRNLDRLPNFESSISRGLLIISQPEISGLPPIPGVQEEVDGISEVMRASRIPFHLLESASATVQNTSQRMKTLACVHIATHAFQHPVEPLGSGFHLHDGPLTLSNIMQSNLGLGDLAFLSACDTSRGDERLSEEAVHLAGGLLAAGYRSVIATMWSINDGYAPTVARSFYEHLIQEGGESQHDTPGRILGLQSAFSIHHAIQELRNNLGDSETSLLKWVPYVHFGL
ncbi:CHAT domain-containing protein [Ephemerocybe angulata]|uniref:CHAT domain-containing protein n=1 Tax=Ephemerocybe angulata TaxID=980116 RepID=A0A8H6HJL8_9AGAR|nr:CHAT domain-containing protein [Tulosesus angulatus]